MDGVIVATCALIRLGLKRRIAQILPFRTNPLQGHLAVVVKSSHHDLLQRFSPLDCRKNWGIVTIAGFGPGNPELLTIKAEKALQSADVIFFDDLLDANHLDRFAGDKIYVGKRSSNHAYSQGAINEMLRQTAISGKNVVRIKGGDPLIFGRGIEEYHYLTANLVHSLIVPGISSGQAAAAQALVPLTARGVSSSVAILSGHDVEKLQIPQADTLVFYMGASMQQQLATKLIESGRNPLTPVAVVQNASYESAVTKRYTLQSLAKAENLLASPVIITVGWTAARSNSDLPPRWLYLGTNPADCKEVGLVIHAPLIHIIEIEPGIEEKKVLMGLDQFERIIFTSRYSVDYFFNWLFKVGLDVRSISHLSIDAIGHVTSEALRAKGLNITPLSADESSDGMLKYYKENDISGQRILLPRSDKGLGILPDGLGALGNEVTVLTVYRNEKPQNLIIQNLDDFYGVVFTAPTTVSRFFEVYGSFPEHLQYRFRGSNTEKRFLELNR
jgi:uroporphyrinogen III methyltransferase/synthase